MSIWNHNETTDIQPRFFASSGKCPFCHALLTTIGEVPNPKPLSGIELAVDLGATVDACPCCGWWTLSWQVQGHCADHDPFNPGGYSHRTYAAAAALRSLDLSDLTIPIDEVRQYLVARSDARFDLHPRLFEETVASVFRDLGYQPRVTCYSGDGGIDVILDGPNSETVGVQVKRWRAAVKVEQIRSLIGALVVGGYTKGVFVTTSRFQSGAPELAHLSSTAGYPLELVDGNHFLQALRLAQLSHPKEYDTTKPPFTEATCALLSFNSGACGDDQRYVWNAA